LIQHAKTVPLTGPLPVEVPTAASTPSVREVRPGTRSINECDTADLGRLVVLTMAVGRGADAPRALIGCDDGQVHEFRLDTGQREMVWKAHVGGPACAVAVGPAGHQVATGGGDGTLIPWDLNAKAPRPTRSFRLGGVKVRSIAYSRDGRSLAAITKDKVVALKTQGTTPGIVSGFPQSVEQASALALSPDGARLWIACDRNFIALDVAAHRPASDAAILASRLASGTPVLALAAHPDGSRLIVSHEDGRLQAWDVTTGEVVRRYETDGQDLKSIAISDDGRRMVGTDGGLTVRVWDLDEGSPIARLVGHTERVLDAEFLPEDGRTVVSLGREPTLRVWDIDGPSENGPRRAWSPDDPATLTKGATSKAKGK
jgi:WD40 repeat protein